MKGYVSVVGPGDGADASDISDAFRAGALLADAGVVVVTGGLGGVMEAAAEGARSADGVSIGLLPGLIRTEGSTSHTLLLPTGMGELRNGLVVRSADIVLSIGGSWGTFSEVSLAMRTGTPVVSVRGWRVSEPGIHHEPDPVAAVQEVLRRLSLNPPM